MHRGRTLLVTIAVCTIVLIIGAAWAGAAPPPRPASFYGTILVNGQNPAAGTTLEARIGGVTYATTQVQLDGGSAVYAIDVPGDTDEPGKQGGTAGETIQFWINGLACSPTVTWQESTQTNQNLTATGTVATSTPTITGIPSDTPTITTTPSQTPTPTNSHTPTQTPLITQTPVVVTLDPEQDTFINSWAPTTNYGTDGSIKARASIMRSLIQFDTASIPTGATVSDAKLRLYLWYPYGHTRANNVSIYKVLADWNEHEATWQLRQSGASWNIEGCAGASDRSAVASATLVVQGEGVWYEWAVRDLVQGWVTDPASNKGLLVDTDMSDELRFSSLDSVTSPASPRPELVINYSGGGSAATPTPTATTSGTPSVEPTDPVVVQTDQFSASKDTYIDIAEPTSQHDNTGMRVQKQGWKRSLMDFDLASLPPNANIVRATLRLTTSTLENTKTLAMPVGAYLVNRQWVAHQATWNLASTGVSWGAAGCDAVPADREGTPANTVTIIDVSGDLPTEIVAYDWDVTAIVQAWVANPSAQAGLLLMTNSDYSRQIGFYDSAYRVAEHRPVLEVQWSASTPTSTPTPTGTITPTPTTTAATGGLAGTVYNDVNANGTREAGELGLIGVAVQLFLGEAQISEQVTAGSGAFLFEPFTAGQYRLKAVPLAGYHASDENPRTVSIIAGQTTQDIDFGMYEVKYLHVPLVIKNWGQ